METGYHRTAAEAITRYGGHVAKYLGDGLMAYFGWPEAHENDAERAARAGLAKLEGVVRLSDELGHQKLVARVGIDSGTVDSVPVLARRWTYSGKRPISRRGYRPRLIQARC